MTTIEVTKETREKIREFAQDESVDVALNRLFDMSDIPSVKCVKEREKRTNIAISDATFERLKQFKLYDKESHSDTILRLLEALE